MMLSVMKPMPIPEVASLAPMSTNGDGDLLVPVVGKVQLPAIGPQFMPSSSLIPILPSLP